jgi:hypothetical protein
MIRVKDKIRSGLILNLDSGLELEAGIRLV